MGCESKASSNEPKKMMASRIKALIKTGKKKGK